MHRSRGVEPVCLCTFTAVYFGCLSKYCIFMDVNLIRLINPLSHVNTQL